jgi:putative hemolysin
VDTGWRYLALLFLLVLSAVFSASETATLSANKIRLKHQADKGNKGARLVLRLRSESNRFLGSVLVGNNLVNIAFSSLVTSLSLALGERGVALAVIVSTVLIVFFGEVLPKTLVSINPESSAIKLARLSALIVKLFHWPAWGFTTLVDLLLRGLGKKQARTALITAEELQTVVETAAREGSLDDSEKELIQGIFHYADTAVEDIMIPRPDILAFSATLSLSEAVKIASKEKYSRIPIYLNTVENIIGFIHVKDLLSAFLAGSEAPLTELARPPLFVPRTKKVDELFAEMRAANAHLAIVLDEYGTTAGLVTMEDILEEIIGEIRDEYDSREEAITPLGDEAYLIKGLVALKEIERELGLVLYEGDDVDTIGGLVFHHLGRIPAKGDTVRINDLELTIEEMKGKRVGKVKLAKKAPPAKNE